MKALYSRQILTRGLDTNDDCFECDMRRIQREVDSEGKEEIRIDS